MRCQNIAKIMRSVRQQPLDGAAACIGVVNPITLDHASPSLVEFRRVVRRIDACRLHCFYEQCARILGAAQQYAAVLVDIRLEEFVEGEQIRQDQPERLLSEEG